VVEHKTMDHSYPHCYRCDSPLIYMAMDTWFMRIDPVKQAMIDANQKTNWVPEGLRDGRFGKWLENARDWNFSRNRFWGTPIPIWRCDAEACDKMECLGSAEELEKHVGKACDDLHKHFVDELTWACSCGGQMRRITEIFDCWFESGSMPYAQSHYPFENKEAFEQNFPADFIAEGLDQTRGWFYTLTVLAASLFDKPAFKNVIVNGIVLAEDGEKMSKSKQNYPDPNIVLEKYGADALRLYLVDSPVVAARDLRFAEAGVADQVRSVMLPLWNAYSFLSRYADVDGWEPDGVAPDASVNELDGWILSRLQTLVGDVQVQMEAYELFRVVPALLGFVDDLTNWYIRLGRPRFWRGADAGEAGLADKLNAYRSLHHVLVTLSQALAPFLPFITEEIYSNLSCGLGADSVHLCDYPVADESLRDEALERRMALSRAAVTLGRSLRVEHSMRIRQPLRSLTVCAADAADRAALEQGADLLKDELNVKEVHVSADEGELVTYTARPNLKLLGPRFGKRLGDIRGEVQALSSEALATVVDGGNVASSGVEGLIYDSETLLVDRSSREGSAVATEGGLTLALDLQLDDELRLEGLAREVVNRVQGVRKERALALDDRIVLEMRAEGDLAQALEAHWLWIASQVLAQEQAPDLTASIQGGLSFDVDGRQLEIALSKA
jgi:isoleucyl-tRNA synthetase